MPFLSIVHRVSNLNRRQFMHEWVGRFSTRNGFSLSTNYFLFHFHSICRARHYRVIFACHCDNGWYSRKCDSFIQFKYCLAYSRNALRWLRGIRGVSLCRRIHILFVAFLTSNLAELMKLSSRLVCSRSPRTNSKFLSTIIIMLPECLSTNMLLYEVPERVLPPTRRIELRILAAL